MRLMERANRLIDEYDLLPGPGGLVLAAVSGGADSVCLLDWLYHVRDMRGFRLAAAHYNHNLRGDESRRDQAFVQTLLADQYPELALFVGAGDVAAQAKRAGRGLEDMGRELYIMVDNGCTVLDVIVEHPVYGQLTGALQLASRYDVQQFILRANAAQPLSLLTEGVHLHTLSCPGEEAFRRVVEALAQAGFLLEQGD